MAGLTAPRIVYGVHSISPYKRADGTFYGIAKNIKGSTISLSGDIVDLYGGSNRFAWASQPSTIKAELSIKSNSYPNFLIELFLGTAPTDNAAEATGAVSTAVNVLGTSVINASNGISAVTATSADEADLKFGKYVIKAVSANTFDLYLSTDADFARGNDGSYQDDTLKLNATPLSIGTTLIEATYGLTFTKVGTPAFVTGDTATFEVKPINIKSMNVTIGSASTMFFPEFGAIVMAQKISSGYSGGTDELFEVDLFRCIGIGMPIGMEHMAFSTPELKAKCLYDAGKDGVMKIRHVIT